MTRLNVLLPLALIAMLTGTAPAGAQSQPEPPAIACVPLSNLQAANTAAGGKAVQATPDDAAIITRWYNRQEPKSDYAPASVWLLSRPGTPIGILLLVGPDGCTLAGSRIPVDALADILNGEPGI